MPWLLEMAMALSIILRHHLEGIIIFVLLTVNAIIGHMHSRGSQRAVEHSACLVGRVIHNH